MSTEAPAADPSPATVTPEEYQSYRTEDKGAATAVVCTMLGIFTLAVVGYTVIAIWVASG